MEHDQIVTIVIDHRVVHKKNYKRVGKTGVFFNDPKVAKFERLCREQAIAQLKLTDDQMPLFGDRELGMRIIAKYRDLRWLHDVSNIGDCICDAFQDITKRRQVITAGALYHDDRQIVTLKVERKENTGVDQIIVSVWPLKGGNDG